jgi:hypothetical protein
LEEIVVTATRREEVLSKVPISVNAFSAEDVEKSGIKSISEIAALTPGVEFDRDSTYGSNLTNIAIRSLGMGNNPIPTNWNFDQPTVAIADDLWSLEAGSKNGLLGGRLQIDASAYQVWWKNIASSGPFANANRSSVIYTIHSRPDPSTNILNFRLSAAKGKASSSLFVTNLTNSQPVLDQHYQLGDGPFPDRSKLAHWASFRPMNNQHKCHLRVLDQRVCH